MDLVAVPEGRWRVVCRHVPEKRFLITRLAKQDEIRVRPPSSSIGGKFRRRRRRARLPRLGRGPPMTMMKVREKRRRKKLQVRVSGLLRGRRRSVPVSTSSTPRERNSNGTMNMTRGSLTEEMLHPMRRMLRKRGRDLKRNESRPNPRASRWILLRISKKFPDPRPRLEASSLLIRRRREAGPRGGQDPRVCPPFLSQQRVADCLCSAVV